MAKRRLSADLVRTTSGVPIGSPCYYDRTGEVFVRQWRATGARDPETLMIMGFGEPELALLDADE